MGSDSSSRVKINNPFADSLQLSADAELIVMGNPINEDADDDAVGTILAGPDSSPDVEEGKAAGGVCRVCNETLRVYTETHPCFREIGDLDDWGCDVCGETLGRDTALHCCETFNECDWAACADCLLLPTQSTGADEAFVADAGKEMRLDPPLIMVATQGLEGAALREAPALDAPTVQQGLLEPGVQIAATRVVDILHVQDGASAVIRCYWCEANQPQEIKGWVREIADDGSVLLIDLTKCPPKDLINPWRDAYYMATTEISVYRNLEKNEIVTGFETRKERTDVYYELGAGKVGSVQPFAIFKVAPLGWRPNLKCPQVNADSPPFKSHVKIATAGGQTGWVTIAVGERTFAQPMSDSQIVADAGGGQMPRIQALKAKKAEAKDSRNVEAQKRVRIGLFFGAVLIYLAIAEVAVHFQFGAAVEGRAACADCCTASGVPLTGTASGDKPTCNTLTMNADNEAQWCTITLAREGYHPQPAKCLMLPVGKVPAGNTAESACLDETAWTALGTQKARAICTAETPAEDTLPAFLWFCFFWVILW